MRFYFLPFFFSAILLAGCAGGGAKFTLESVQKDKGVIYVYMPPTLFHSNTKGTMTVHVDGKEIGYIGPGVYYPVRVEPGLRTVALGNDLSVGELIRGKYTVKVPVSAGQSYYVRLSLIVHTPSVQTVVPERVSSQIGTAEIRDTHRG